MKHKIGFIFKLCRRAGGKFGGILWRGYMESGGMLGPLGSMWYTPSAPCWPHGSIFWHNHTQAWNLGASLNFPSFFKHPYKIGLVVKSPNILDLFLPPRVPRRCLASTPLHYLLIHTAASSTSSSLSSPSSHPNNAAVLKLRWKEKPCRKLASCQLGLP